MKNLSRFIIFMIVAITWNACKVNEQQTVSKIAKEFLDNINAKKYAKAKKLCTKESAASIDMLESFAKLSNEQKPEPKIENLVCRIDDDRASCDYMENGEQKKLELVKINGKWLVEMKKETPDVNTNSDSNHNQEMIADSIKAVDEYNNNREHDYNNNYNNDERIQLLILI